MALVDLSPERQLDHPGKVLESGSQRRRAQSNARPRFARRLPVAPRLATEAAVKDGCFSEQTLYICIHNLVDDLVELQPIPGTGFKTGILKQGVHQICGL